MIRLLRILVSIGRITVTPHEIGRGYGVIPLLVCNENPARRGFFTACVLRHESIADLESDRHRSLASDQRLLL